MVWAAVITAQDNINSIRGRVAKCCTSSYCSGRSRALEKRRLKTKKYFNMCLYPREMKNKKYTITKKNGGNVPEKPIIGHKWLEVGSYKDEDHKQAYRVEIKQKVYDERVSIVQIPCGNCIECLKQRANDWKIRLYEEIKHTEYNYFITLTFSPEGLKEMLIDTGLRECNAVAGKALRRMLERWRKKHKKSLKHWFITEMGHEGTERIHLHGLILSDTPLEFDECKENKQFKYWKYWKYGHIFVGDFVNTKTINYIMKYVTKLDTDHKGFKGEIFCSPGIAKGYASTPYFKQYKYIKGASPTFYITEHGDKVRLPVYWKNKAYTEEERELIWRDSMDKGETYIMGNTYNKNVPKSTIKNIRSRAQETNEKLGYGSDAKEWQKHDYNVTSRMLKKAEKDGKTQFLQMRREISAKK